MPRPSANITRDPAKKKPFQLVNKPIKAALRTRFTKNFDWNATSNALAVGQDIFTIFRHGTADDTPNKRII